MTIHSNYPQMPQPWGDKTQASGAGSQPRANVEAPPAPKPEGEVQATSVSPSTPPPPESGLAKRRGRPRDEPALVEALVKGARAIASSAESAITIDSVVAAAGTSKPRVYRYFPSADATFSRVFSEVLEGFATTVRNTLAGQGESDERVARLHTELESEGNDLRTTCRLLMFALHQALRDTDLAARVRSIDTILMEAYEGLFGEAQNERRLSHTYTPQSAAESLLRLTRGAMIEVALGAPPSAVSEAIRKFWNAAVMQAS